ncbi:hypothetical protein ACFVIY_41400 [Streptomyces sp. NPDC127166]|uniref:hypothetical protein n=1 Tax=Streptomyces sp. NPDC127166 TaxID=3345380 RepID=UPI003644FB09
MVELSITGLRNLLTSTEQDLAAFLALAAGWASRHLPDHCTPITAALTHSSPPRPHTTTAIGRQP